MTYEEALKYIHSVSNFFCKPGLERITELCDRLGNPQNQLKFIHVAGTNGKGSFCAMTDSILRAEGYKVGLFTSPYVRNFNERMRVNGENIPNDTLARLTEKAKIQADKMTDSPTEFELITAIAFDYFREQNCDVVILEVGMGGRLDATNIIKKPLLSVITGIALDHIAYLGDTVEKIAAEKAGVIKEKSIALWGGNDPDAEAVIDDFSIKMQTVLYKTDYSWLKIKNFDLSGTTFDYRERRDIHISMLGEYQPRNAAVVLDAVDLLSGVGLSVSEEAIRHGLAEARWPARFEIISRDPLVLFDGAHNSQGIRAAVESVKRYFGDKKLLVITGVLRDKDYMDISASISEIASKAYVITPENPRALTSPEYAEILSERSVLAVPCDSIGSALNLALADAKSNDTPLICLGSLYTYGDIVSYITSK